MSNEPQNISKDADEYIEKYWYEQSKEVKTKIHLAYRASATKYESELLKLKRENEKLKELIIDAVQYGFGYALNSQNDGKSVPTGNILQWLQYHQSK